MKLQTRFDYEKVQFNQEKEVHLVVSVKAPAQDQLTKRPPVCITLVADVSGSMGGNKLDYVQKSICKLIDHLQPGDYCGLVTFASDVRTIFPPQEITQLKKDELKAKAEALRASSSTNFSGGMLEGLSLANKLDLPQTCINRVIILTDGQANTGVATKAPDILKILEANLGNASLSAFGYGDDADQELLTQIAKQGKGNYAFIKNPDDALSTFGKELGGLLSTYAQNITIDIEPSNGHQIEEVLSDVDVTEQAPVEAEVGGKVVTLGDKSIRITLPDIFSEEERHLVLRMKLAKQTQALPRQVNIASIKVGYDLLDEGKRVRKTEEAKAKLSFVKDGEQQDKPNPEVDKIVALAQLVKKQIEAETMAQAGNFAAAQNALGQIEQAFIARGLDANAKAARGLRSRMGSAQSYASSQGFYASMRSAGGRAYGNSGADNDAVMFLSDMEVPLENSVQTATSQAFAEDASVAPKYVPGGAVLSGGDLAAALKLATPAASPENTPSKPNPKTLSKSRRKDRW